MAQSGCTLCALALVKRTKSSNGFIEQQGCEEGCNEDSCVAECECGRCMCEKWCYEAEGDGCIDECCCDECNEDRMYATRWDSLYIDGMGPASKGRAVDYEMCSPQELKRMIQDRGLDDPYPQGTTMKYFYVRTLAKADRTPSTFRFLDLSPELRNLIYEELLRLPTNACSRHRFCFPQILCASNQVRNEATELLYCENVVKCDFATRCTGFSSGSYTVATIHNDELDYGGCPCGCNFNIMDATHTHVPSFLRSIQFIDILVDFSCRHSSAHTTLPVRTGLLVLASALMDQNCLKRLRITVRAAHDGEDEDVSEWPGISHVLQPLRRLRNIAKVEVLGRVSASTASEIATDIQGDSPTFNTIKQLQLISAEANAYRDLCRLTDSIAGDEDEECADKTPSARDVIMHHLEEIEFMLDSEVGDHMLSDEETEDELSAQLTKLKTSLDSAETDLVKAMGLLTATKKDRVSYTTDARTGTHMDFSGLSQRPTPPSAFE